MGPDNFRRWIIIIALHLLRLVVFVVWTRQPFPHTSSLMLAETQKMIRDLGDPDHEAKVTSYGEIPNWWLAKPGDNDVANS